MPPSTSRARSHAPPPLTHAGLLRILQCVHDRMRLRLGLQRRPGYGQDAPKCACVLLIRRPHAYACNQLASAAWQMLMGSLSPMTVCSYHGNGLETCASSNTTDHHPIQPPAVSDVSLVDGGPRLRVTYADPATPPADLEMPLVAGPAGPQGQPGVDGKDGGLNVTYRGAGCLCCLEHLRVHTVYEQRLKHVKYSHHG